MPERSRSTIPRSWLLAAAVLFVLWVAYTFLVLQQLLLGVLPLLLFGGVYLVWRFLVAFEAIADGVQRLAEQRERDGE